MTWLVVQVAGDLLRHFPHAAKTTLPQPVQRGLAGADALTARGLAVGAADEIALASLRAVRHRATTFSLAGDAVRFATDAGPLEVPRADLGAGFVVEERGDELLCLARRSTQGLIVLARSTLDPSFLPAPRPPPPEAFRATVAGFARLLGRPVDESLRGFAGAFGLSPVDVVDLGVSMLKGELPAPSEVAAVAAVAPAIRSSTPARTPEQAPGMEPRPVPLPDDDPPRFKKCQSCDEAVNEADSYRVFSLPSCDSCTQKYIHGGRDRALMLAGMAVGSLVVFLVLTLPLGTIGRVAGGLLVVFAFAVVLQTGAQYDVDVERQRARELVPIRRAGFFKKWGELEAKWWGKWLVRRGLYTVLGFIAWLAPISADGYDEEVMVAESPPVDIPRHVLKPLGPPVNAGAASVALVEVVSSDEALSFVMEIGGKQKTVDGGELEQTLGQLGLVILDVTLPPQPPAITVAKKSDVPSEWLEDD